MVKELHYSKKKTGLRSPEEWVVDLENRVPEWRAGGHSDWQNPAFDHWRLWVELQSRKRLLKNGPRWTANRLPEHIGLDGKPNLTTLANALNASPKTVQRHLGQLTALGADFARLGEWPHPLHGPIPAS